MSDREDEIRERLNKATPGSWELEFNRSVSSKDGERIITAASHFEDAFFIAYAPDDIKYLLEQITALQAENATLKSDLLDGSKTGYEAMKRENEQLKEEAFRYKSSWELESDWHKCWIKISEKAKHDNATLTKALEMACLEACDEQCPRDFYEIDWADCKGCTIETDLRYDIDKEQKCWVKYYIQKARSTNSKEGADHDK